MKKQKNINHNEGKNQLIETDSELMKMFDLANKDSKRH